jgi:hypothetical protein
MQSRKKSLPRPSLAHKYVNVAVIVSIVCLLGVGAAAQFRKAPAPAWARFVDGSMAWAITPERVGPARYVRFTLTPAGGDGSPRYAMIENGGAHQWKTDGRFAASLGRGRVMVFTERSAGRGMVASVPAWAAWGPGLALCALPALSWVARRRALRGGLCATCGYDLRGTADGMPCPECGSARSDSAANSGDASGRSDQNGLSGV